MEPDDLARPTPQAQLDFDRPNAARMYDYLLGGAHNFEVDRSQVHALLSTNPDAREVARANRAFLFRVVAWCLEHGIDQFLDLGSGVPTVGNVHEVALRRTPTARVAYVDIDPVATAHAGDLLAGEPRASVTLADLCDVDEVLAAPAVTRTLDGDRPIALLALAVLHFVPGDVGDVLERYRRVLAPGSVTALSHIVQGDTDGGATSDERLRAGAAVYRRSSTPLHFRSRPELLALVADLELVEPGLVDIRTWPHRDTSSPASGVLGCVARQH